MATKKTTSVDEAMELAIQDAHKQRAQRQEAENKSRHNDEAMPLLDEMPMPDTVYSSNAKATDKINYNPNGEVKKRKPKKIGVKKSFAILLPVLALLYAMYLLHFTGFQQSNMSLNNLGEKLKAYNYQLSEDLLFSKSFASPDNIAIGGIICEEAVKSNYDAEWVHVDERSSRMLNNEVTIFLNAEIEHNQVHVTCIPYQNGKAKVKVIAKSRLQ